MVIFADFGNGLRKKNEFEPYHQLDMGQTAFIHHRW